MVFVDIVNAGGGQVSAVINGKIRSTGANATAVLIDVAKTVGGATIYCPKAMALCMKAGDIVSRGDVNSTAAPAYTSSRR